MQPRPGSSSRLLDLPQPALEAVASSLGCAAANARRAHPVLCAAIDRQLPAVTINATSSSDVQGLRLSQLPKFRTRFPGAEHIIIKASKRAPCTSGESYEFPGSSDDDGDATSSRVAAVLSAFNSLPAGAWAGVTSVEVHEADEYVLIPLMQQLARVCPGLARVSGIPATCSHSDTLVPLLPVAGSLQHLDLVQRRPGCIPLVPGAARLLASFSNLRSLTVTLGAGHQGGGGLPGALGGCLAEAVRSMTALTRLDLDIVSDGRVDNPVQQDPNEYRLNLGSALAGCKETLHELRLSTRDQEWMCTFAGCIMAAVTRLEICSRACVSTDAPPLSEVAAALPGLMSMDASQAGTFVIHGDLPCCSELTELRVAALVSPPNDFGVGDDGMGLFRLAPRLRKLALGSPPSGHSLQGLAAEHAFLQDVEIGGMLFNERCPSECNSMRALASVTALTLTSGNSSRLPYKRCSEGGLLRRASVLHWHALAMPPALASFVYDGCWPILLSAVLPLLADALGQTLRRLELRRCVMPDCADEGGRAARSLVLFDSLECVQIRADEPIYVKIEGLEGLAGPLLEVPARCAGRALRSFVVQLPTSGVDARIWGRCSQLAAASRPPVSVQFELFGRYPLGHVPDKIARWAWADPPSPDSSY